MAGSISPACTRSAPSWGRLYAAHALPAAGSLGIGVQEAASMHASQRTLDCLDGERAFVAARKCRQAVQAWHARRLVAKTHTSVSAAAPSAAQLAA